jgi:hypothetical protein
MQIFLILFFYGCVEDKEIQPSINAFEVSESCPNVCWLGIHPGTTTTAEAVEIVMTSNQMDREDFVQVLDTEIQTVWGFTDQSGAYRSRVYINFNNGLVESIGLSMMKPFTLGDFISLLGEPDIIVIEIDHTIHGNDIVNYAVYFSVKRVSISVYPGAWDGPNSQDFIETVVLNSEFTYHPFFKEAKQQPWLGYGQLDKYLPGQELPSGPYVPSKTNSDY